MTKSQLHQKTLKVIEIVFIWKVDLKCFFLIDCFD